MMFRTVREQIDTVFRRDPAARSVIEILLCYPGFHAVLLHPYGARLIVADGSPGGVVSQFSGPSPALRFTRARPSDVDSLSTTAWAL
jgi:hypothetical protein